MAVDASQSQQARLEAVLEPICKAHGLVLFDVRLSPEAGGAVLRVLIERMPAAHAASEELRTPPEDGAGVSLLDCQQVSRDLSTALDVNPEVAPAGRYRLEVGSPGLDRPLYKLEHFRRFVGREVKLQTRKPLGDRRRFRGVISSVQGSVVELGVEQQSVEIPYEQIAKANLVF